MPSLTQIKRRKLLSAHQIQQVEDQLLDAIHDGKVHGGGRAISNLRGQDG